MKNNEKEHIVTGVLPGISALDISNNQVDEPNKGIDQYNNDTNNSSSDLITDAELKQEVIKTLISGSIAVVGIAGYSNIMNVDLKNLIHAALYVTTINMATILGSSVFMIKIFEILWALIKRLEDKANKKAKLKEESDLVKYNISRENYENYKTVSQSPELTPQHCKYFMDLNITPEKYKEIRKENISVEMFIKLQNLNVTVDEYQKLKKEYFTVEEYSKYKQGVVNATPEEYFIQNIDNITTKNKKNVISAIIAGVGAIATVGGIVVSMTHPDAEVAFKSQFVGLGGIIPLFSGSMMSMSSIYEKLKLKREYEQIMAKNSFQKEKRK